jgi:diguanylate cyclase (GGDEF)-like protein
MQETLFDRFRPFKPYDLALALLMLLLVVPGSQLSPLQQMLTIAGGVAAFFGLDWIQRYVRVPTPFWQSIAVVSANTIAIAVLIHLNDAHRYGLAFSILNTSFAAIAFGPHAGIQAAVLSVALLASIEIRPSEPQARYEWGLFLAVLVSLVAIIDRVSRLQRDALFDAVTKLRNHRYFQVRLREEIGRTKRYGRPTSLLLIDLDNFKRINDQFGHATGDQVLRQVADLLMENSRASDIVCRYGGEELAVILPETAAQEALQVAERLRLALEHHQDVRAGVVTLSAGVAACPDHGADADSLIAAADAAMYRAKGEGKNRVAVAQCWLTNQDTVKDD